MLIDTTQPGAGVRLYAAGIVAVLAGCSGSASGAPPGIPEPSPPEGVRVIANESFYEISGHTAEELDAAIQRHGPGAAERGLVGSHAWALRGEFGPDSRGWGCTFGEGRVSLWSTITMPRWRNRDEAAPALVAEWDRFLANLWNHQYSHREIAYRAAGEALRRLEKYERRSCKESGAASQEVAEVIAEYRELTRLYDHATGATEAGVAGAYWPPTEGAAEAGPPRP